MPVLIDKSAIYTLCAAPIYSTATKQVLYFPWAISRPICANCTSLQFYGTLSPPIRWHNGAHFQSIRIKMWLDLTVKMTNYARFNLN